MTKADLVGVMPNEHKTAAWAVYQCRGHRRLDVAVDDPRPAGAVGQAAEGLVQLLAGWKRYAKHPSPTAEIEPLGASCQDDDLLPDDLGNSSAIAPTHGTGADNQARIRALQSARSIAWQTNCQRFDER